ncbi:hypothetical protein TB1_009398 [Malus domestica]
MNALMASPKWFFSLVLLTLVLSFSLPSCSSVEGDHGIDSASPPLFPLNPQVADHHLKFDLTMYYTTLLNLCFLHRATGTPIDFGQGSHGHYQPPASALYPSFLALGTLPSKKIDRRNTYGNLVVGFTI